jgi:outer membrane protein OmpA-like peptidoglycan-associated protein
MKSFLLLACIFGVPFSVFCQNLKIKQAESYFNTFRFAEATLIYQELIVEDQLSLAEHASIFRHAVIAAGKCRNYELEYNVLNSLYSSNSCTFEDAYRLFQISRFLGLYEKATEVLNSTQLTSIPSNSRAEKLKEYDGKVDWASYTKDTSTNKIHLWEFNSQKDDFGAMFHPDGIVFSSARDYSARKNTIDDSYFLNLYLYNTSTGKTDRLNFLKSKRHDATACYDSAHQVWFYAKNLSFHKNELTKTGLFIYDERTKKETAFPFNSKEYFVAQPFLSGDGQLLWFSSDKPGGYGKSDLWYSKRSSVGWEEPVNAGALVNTADDEMFAFYQKDKLYFSSNGHKGLGGLDIYSVNFKNNVASSLVHLQASVNSNGDDFALLLDQYGKKGYFSSNRNGWVDNIYTVELSDLNFVFVGTFNSEEIPSGLVQNIPIVVKKEGVIIDTLFVDKIGKFVFEGERNSNYSFSVEDASILSIHENYSTVGKMESDTTTRNFDLLSKFVAVSSVVFDQQSKLPLPNAKVSVVNKATGEETTYLSDEKGEIHATLPRNQDFEVKSSAVNYLNNLSTLSTMTRDKEISTQIDMKKIVLGSSLKTNELSFDFNKWNLKPESKLELNGIVHFLKENPTVKIEFSSHTDCRGAAAYNMELARKRTESAVNYLILQGVQKDRIVGKWFGETIILNHCEDEVVCSDREHGVNRRTEIKIIGE